LGQKAIECENRPLFIGEYGVDTIAGLHNQPPVKFSEEFQIEFLDAYNKVFDELGFKNMFGTLQTL
jgi:beta-glucuronidase